MDIVLIAILTFFASGVGTLTWFGTFTIMAPGLVSFFPLAQTLLFVKPGLRFLHRLPAALDRLAVMMYARLLLFPRNVQDLLHGG